MIEFTTECIFQLKSKENIIMHIFKQFKIRKLPQVAQQYRGDSARYHPMLMSIDNYRFRYQPLSLCYWGPYATEKKNLSRKSRIQILALKKVISCHPYRFLFSLQESSRELYTNSRSFSQIIFGRLISKTSANNISAKRQL